MNKVEPMMNLTPALLTRLKALQGLHTESATFAKSIKMISEEQDKITEELGNLGGASSQVSFLGVVFNGRKFLYWLGRRRQVIIFMREYLTQSTFFFSKAVQNFPRE
jgi:hypothetical protein